MSQIKAEQVSGASHTLITVCLSRVDYANQYNKALQKLAQTTNLQGFRPGKTPVKLIEKMHGRAIFVEEVLRVAQSHLFEYLEREKIDFLLTPLLHQDEVKLSSEAEEQVVKFELALKPELNLDFLREIKLTGYNITLSDDRVQEELLRLRKTCGSMEKAEQIGEQEPACVTLECAVDAEKPKSVTLWLRDLTKSAFAKWKGLAVNSEVSFDLDKDLLVSAKANCVDNFHRQGLPSAGSAKITEIRNLVPANLDSKFFQQVFPNETQIATEEDFLQKFRQVLQDQLVAEEKFIRQLQVNQMLISQDQIQLPEKFIRRWIDQDRRRQQKPELNREEWVSLLGGIRRQLIMQKWVQQEKIEEANPEQLQEFVKNKLSQQFQGYALSADMQAQLLERAMKDEEYVDKMRNEYVDNQAIQRLLEFLNFEVEEVDDKKFREIAEKFYKKSQQRPDVNASVETNLSEA